MRCLFIFITLLSSIASANDCVVLLHGLGRTSYSMKSIETALRNDGYTVVNNGYPSRDKHISELAIVVENGIKQCKQKNASDIHFVTHSLGGILVRQYFQKNSVPEVKRVVMLGPPNHGSEVSTKNKDKWWYKLLTGPAGQQLGTESTSIPNQLKPIPLEIGIISGTKSLDPWFSSDIEKPHDGKVSVASTKLAEMKDFISVAHSHTFIADSDTVAKQVKLFLSKGGFNHNP